MQVYAVLLFQSLVQTTAGKDVPQTEISGKTHPQHSLRNKILLDAKSVTAPLLCSHVQFSQVHR